VRNAPVVFFSWQSDTDDSSNRRLLKRSLDQVCAKLTVPAVAELSPRVDSGMSGVSGSPEVASVMFQKIDSATVFVGDMTLVGSIVRADRGSKRVPNPNVLTEMGYAAARLGWDRVINVMNEHYGRAEDMPFDVRNRRFPITYSLPPNQKSSVIEDELKQSLRVALRTAFAEKLRTAEDALARLDHACVDLFERNANQDKWWPSTYSRSGQEPLSPEKHAIARLLDLKLVAYCEAPDQASPWHYEWTYTGHEVIALWRQRSRGRGRFDSKPLAPSAEATDASDKPSI
jgi:hypothetical protein